MIYRFEQAGELDAPVRVTVAAYLDCEHYVHLHRALTDSLEVLSHEGFAIIVRQTWRWLGLRLGHVKRCEYIPPSSFKISDVRPSPWWVPSVHHLLGITTWLAYTENTERDSTEFLFRVELDLPFFLWPFRGRLKRMILLMHDQQNAEDMALIKRRERLFGRGNISAYLADHHFMYHKDEYVRLFGKAAA